jgi:hypothetical protein
MDLFQIILNGVTTVVLIITIVQTVRITRDTKAVDVILQCTKRYDDLVWVQKHQVYEKKLPATTYYIRFWNLQLEQFQFWLLGFLSDEIFKYWLTCRFKEWKEDKAEGEVGYKDGWGRAMEVLPRSAFITFMQRVSWLINPNTGKRCAKV